MSRISSIVEKIDNLSYVTEIGEVSSLAEELLQLQQGRQGRGQNIDVVQARGHARYPHLVPMYRTVHRKVPRPMVLRAIRWVNPKRMMPGALLTKEEMMAMSPEELKKLAVDLNTYREEAHVIHNRYGQMLELIELGEEPYYIPWKGFDGDRWEVLAQYKERASRLKAGTEDWGRALDKQAMQLRSILLSDEKGNIKFDDIPELWVGAGGKAVAPHFMNVKEAWANQVALRKNWIVDGDRVAVGQEFQAQKFIAVPEEEVRLGESVRGPKAGMHINLDAINDPRMREIAEAMGEGAMHLIRWPKFPFPVPRAELQGGGQFFSKPGGENGKGKLVVYNTVAEPEVRRANRWTQGRGARHQGAPSGPGGRHQQIDPIVRPAREADRPRGEPQERRRQWEPAAPRGSVNLVAYNEGDGLPTQRKIDRRNQITKDVMDILNEENIQEYKFLSPEQSPTRERNPGEDVFDNVKRTGAGGIRASQNLTVEIDGNKWIYKGAPGDTRGEFFAFGIDRALGLNVTPKIELHNFGAIELQKGVVKSPEYQDKLAEDGESEANDYANRAIQGMVDGGPQGGGHLMEFCDGCPKSTTAAGKRMLKQASSTKEGRESFLGLAMLDFITGNTDRHSSNWLVHPEQGPVAIDNALGNFSPDVEKDQRHQIGEYTRNAFNLPRDDWRDVKNPDGSDITRQQLQEEVVEFFNKTLGDSNNQELLNRVTQGMGITLTNMPRTVEETTALRERFSTMTVSVVRELMSNFSGNR